MLIRASVLKAFTRLRILISAGREYQPRYEGEGPSHGPGFTARLRVVYLAERQPFSGDFWCPGAELNHRREDFQSYYQ